jgi:hypothetical protein
MQSSEQFFNYANYFKTFFVEFNFISNFAKY